MQVLYDSASKSSPAGLPSKLKLDHAVKKASAAAKRSLRPIKLKHNKLSGKRAASEGKKSKRSRSPSHSSSDSGGDSDSDNDKVASGSTSSGALAPLPCQHVCG
jgi:flagellar capping protein FliD